VCLNPAELYSSGRLGGHPDDTGEKCVMSGHKAPPWDERSTREAVPSRSGGICEFCGLQRATELHHRKNRSQGGEWSPANCLHLCAKCHRKVTVNPDWARSLGLSVKSTEDPEKVPVTRNDLTGFQPTSMVTRKGGRR
jgi:hypothetical protein